MKASADEKLKVVLMMKVVSDSIENIVGKGENACYQHFLLFPQCSPSGKKPGLFGREALVFTYLLYKSFENTVGTEEIACNEQFLLFLQCFVPFWRTFCHIHKTLNCRLQTLSVWKSKNFIIWEWTKASP